jgi:hypothetical protein
MRHSQYLEDGCSKKWVGAGFLFYGLLPEDPDPLSSAADA